MSEVGFLSGFCIIVRAGDDSCLKGPGGDSWLTGTRSVLRLGAATGRFSSILGCFFLPGIGGGGKFGSTFW